MGVKAEMTCSYSYSWRRILGVIAIFAGMAAVAAWLLFIREANGPDLQAASQRALRRPAGYAQLISHVPLPQMNLEMGGAMCEWVPASSPTLLRTALRQEGLAARAAARSSSASRSSFEGEGKRVAHDSLGHNGKIKMVVGDSCSFNKLRLFSQQRRKMRGWVRRQRVNLQLRSEFYNLFNRANFGLPDGDVFSDVDGLFNSSVGRINSTTTTAREIQFGLAVGLLTAFSRRA